MVVKPKNIDEYLAAMSDDKRAALERLRKIIRAAVPRAEECISYQLPAFRLDGKCFVWFGAAANHCAIYGVLGDHKDELKDYDTSKGTIRFQADKAMPAALVRKLIKARIAENVGSVHETENKARLAFGRCPGVAVERTSVAIIKTSEVVQEIIQLRDGGALGFALNLTPRLRAAPGTGSRGPASVAGPPAPALH